MIAERSHILNEWKKTGVLPSSQRSTSEKSRAFEEDTPSEAVIDEAKIYAEAFTMPPERAIQHLESKGYAITWDWREMSAKSQQKAFTVAKVMTLDILQMIRKELQKAQAEGIPFAKFKKNLQPQLEESGWWGKKEVENPNTGQKEIVQLGSAWRLETVYRTNLQSARSQGRYKQQKESAALLPFLEYLQIDRKNKRDKHSVLHNKIFRVDDPIWQRIYPPRGFNCGCSVSARSAKWMERNKRQVNDSRELKDWQPDEGWDFSPEEDWNPMKGCKVQFSEAGSTYSCGLDKYDNDLSSAFKTLQPPSIGSMLTLGGLGGSLAPAAPAAPPVAAPTQKTAAPKAQPQSKPQQPLGNQPVSTPSIGSQGFPSAFPSAFPPAFPSAQPAPAPQQAAKPKAKPRAATPSTTKPTAQPTPFGLGTGSFPSSFPSAFPSAATTPQPSAPITPKAPAAKTAPAQKTPKARTKKPVSTEPVERPSSYTDTELEQFVRRYKSLYDDYKYRVKKIREITAPEEFALWHYTGAYYDKINSALRKGTKSNEVLVFEKFLNAALEKAPKYILQPGETLKRGLTFSTRDELNAFLEGYKEGNQVQWNAFSSCSYGDSAAFAGDVVFEITSNSGVKIDTVSQYPNEKEVLLPSKMNFVVTGKPVFRRGRWYVSLQEVT